MPNKKIDWNKVNDLLANGCKGIDIANIIGVHYDTLANRCKIEKGLKFSEYMQSFPCNRFSHGAWKFIDRALMVGAPITEVAHCLGVSRYTLAREIIKVKYMAPGDYKQQQRNKGCVAIRLAQFELATGNYGDGRKEKPNAKMLIWLGKNRLGQSNKPTIRDRDQHKTIIVC